MVINFRDELESIRKKAIANREQPDCLWRSLCSVVATSGSSVNAEAFMAQYDTVLRFDRLPSTRAARRRAIFAALECARVPRMRNRKAQELSENYVKVHKLGGAEAATTVMLRLAGKKEKKAWIRMFDGVGEKYSNDIWMDIYDSDFRNAIALDTRVKNFAAALGFNVNSRELESDLLEFAKSCSLTGWEFDRLVYHFGGLLLRTLQAHTVKRAA